MSLISIVRVGDGNAKPITISDGKTVIGRGPFLQVTDKRVSRNHGVLEVSDGKLYLTPTHTNPCFFKKTANSSVEIMKKDDRRLLENGHIFGLLPDSLYFKVQCPATQNGTNKSRAKSKEGKGEISEEEEEPAAPQKPRPWQTVKTEDGKEMTLPLEKKRKLPPWMLQIAKAGPPASKQAAVRQTAKTPTKRKKGDEDDYSPAKKKTPAREGTSRRRKTESEEDEDFDVEEEEEEEKSTTKRGRGTSKKKYYDGSDDDLDDDWEAEEEYKPKKRTPAKARHTPKAKPKPRRKARESSEEVSEEDLPKKKKRGKSRKARRDSSEDEMPSTSSRASRAARAKRQSYVDDFVDFSDEENPNKELSKDEDSDFVFDEGEESASDWEMEGKKSSQKKNQGTPSRRSSRTVGRRKKYADSDGEESLSEDEYVPRSTRKRQTGKTKRGHGRRKKKASSDEDESGSSSDDYVAPERDPKTKKRKDGSASEEEESEEETPKKKAPVKKAKKRKQESDSEEEEDDDDDEGEDKKDKREEVKKVRQLKSKHRPPCMFGKKCYRKNPEHFAEFSHPGDVSYDEQSDLDEEEERRDCPYGNNCYRTNISHLKQYKHYTRDRETKQDAQLPTGDQGKGDEESTGPNTYDYNDSFINDESQNKSDDEKAASESDQDASEDEDDDVKQLKKEAKGFVKNEKMTKPV